ncbi:MAG TPA: stilbene synthase [Opitutales bacterium]|nr:stilbene synthase [Opitutales bacterium]
MYLQSIATAVPAHSYTQSECWTALSESRTGRQLRPGSLRLAERVMLGNSGIEKRHFALQPGNGLFEASASELNAAFEQEGPRLGGEALRLALQRAGLQAAELDALFVCTCTGYLCPGLSSYLAENLGMPPSAYLQDIVGQGCGAAIPTLRSASHFLAAHPDARVAVLAVEVCSAAFYIDDDPGVIISACLFGDGAAATIWHGDHKTGGLQLGQFDTVHIPEDRGLLRFTSKEGKLRNILSPLVPERAAEAVHQLYRRAALSAGTESVPHPGGREVLRSIDLALPMPCPIEAANVLRDYGNMSSPSVLFVLEEILKRERAPHEFWLTSFGAGFSCHSCRAHRKNQVGDLMP